MARKKKSRGRRRTPVRILPLMAMGAAVSDLAGKPVFPGQVQQFFDAYSIGIGNTLNMPSRSPLRAVVGLGVAGIASSALTSVAPQSKITVGKYVVRL